MTNGWLIKGLKWLQRQRNLMCALNEMEGVEGDARTGSREVVVTLLRPKDAGWHRKLGQTVMATWHFLCIYHIQKCQNKSPSNPRPLKEDIKRKIKNPPQKKKRIRPLRGHWLAGWLAGWIASHAWREGGR